ncbi:MAG: hypothetical protein ACRDCC_07270, partial [Culicoidibacterales bacterium]
MPVKTTTALPKKRFKTEFQKKIVAFAPTEPEPFVFDTPKKLKLAAFVAATSAVTTVAIGGAYHVAKKFIK